MRQIGFRQRHPALYRSNTAALDPSLIWASKTNGYVFIKTITPVYLSHVQVISANPSDVILKLYFFRNTKVIYETKWAIWGSSDTISCDARKIHLFLELLCVQSPILKILPEKFAYSSINQIYFSVISSFRRDITLKTRHEIVNHFFTHLFHF